MKKIISLFVACMLILCGLTACGGPDNGDPTPKPAGSTLSGSIDISMPFYGELKMWEAVRDAYQVINPNVTIYLNDMDAANYSNWLSQKLNAGDLKADVVIGNQHFEYFSKDKFVDFQPYFNKKNPYSVSKGRWYEELESSAMKTDYGESTYLLNVDYVQVGWFYNKDLFRKAGLTVDGSTTGEPKTPKTWDELVDFCRILRESGVSNPVAIGGQVDEFWGGDLSWLYMLYTDQYWREYEDQFASQPGDYNYDEDIMGTWDVDDMDNLDNDIQTNYIENKARVLKMLLEGKVGPGTDKYNEMHANIKKLIPEYAPSDFFSLTKDGAISYFLTGDCAMIMNMTNWSNFYDKNVEAENKSEIGFFFSPPMTGEYLGCDVARSLGGPSGYYVVVNKNKAQNDLVMDFLMFFASKQGQEIRYRELEKLNVYPVGVSLVKGVELPEAFSVLEDVGYNGDAQNNPAIKVFSRGIEDNRESIRDFQTNAQSYLQGKISLTEFSSRMKTLLTSDTMIAAVLDSLGWRTDALTNPALDPRK